MPQKEQTSCCSQSNSTGTDTSNAVQQDTAIGALGLSPRQPGVMPAAISSFGVARNQPPPVEAAPVTVTVLHGTRLSHCRTHKQILLHRRWPSRRGDQPLPQARLQLACICRDFLFNTVFEAKQVFGARFIDTLITCGMGFDRQSSRSRKPGTQ